MSGTWRSVLVVGIVMVLVGCSSGSPSTASGPPSTTTPSARTTPVLSPTVPPPTLTPSLEPMEPTALDPVVVLRVDIRPDVSFGRMPTISVYRDGTVLRQSDRGGDIVRLTDSGLAQLLAVATGSGLLDRSSDIDPDPSYQAGYVTYSIALRRSGTLVERSVVNAPRTTQRAEAERVIALADRLATPETWLPPTGWLRAPASAVRWVPDRYLLKVQDWGSVSGAPIPVDVADVSWPLGESPLTVGAPMETPATGPKVARCGVLSLADARRIEAALADAFGDQRIPAAYLTADLDWAQRQTYLSLGLHALLPDDPSDCAVDECWP